MSECFFAVTGKPIVHSRSPQMQRAALDLLCPGACYTRIAADSAAEALALAQEIGFSGLNVTAPFKEEMYRLMGSAADSGIAAVNTVTGIGDTARGYNTDIRGVLGALAEQDVAVAGRRAVVLGAGGAGMAAAQALREGGASVVIVNRSAEKGERAAASAGVRAAPLGDDRGREFIRDAHIIVSCLATGDSVVSPELLAPSQVIFEAGYAHESALVRDGRAKGCRIIEGSEWLLHQGAEAFRHFTGKVAPLEAMREGLAAARPCVRTSIALIGIMGAGKSSVAALLGKELNLPVIELDARIEQHARRTIREIFERDGEEAFRTLEEQMLGEASTEGPHILSCGGGLPIRSRNREILAARYLTIWLWVRGESVLARDGSSGKRPILATCGGAEGVKALIKQRIPAYSSAADLVLTTEGRTAEEVAQRLAYEIHSAR